MRYIVALTTATALVPFCSITPLAAQETKEQIGTSPQYESSGLHEIVVTARKRAESVQDVPVAVTAISAADIYNQDLTSVEKVAARTPNFTVGRASNGSGAQITMRGIGSPYTSIGIEQSVAVVVDGVYYGQGRIINEGFFDLERVEVLKGPQALFFGKNATAGVISLTSADPTSELEVRTRASYEFTAKQAQVEVIGSGPVTDTLGVRLALRGSEMFGGYYTNAAGPVPYDTFDVATGVTTPHTALPAPRRQPQSRELLGRFTAKWEPTNQIAATLKVSGTYANDKNGSWNYVVSECERGVSTLNPTYGCSRDFTLHQNNFPIDIAQTFPRARDDGRLFNKYRSWAATGNVTYTGDDVTLTMVNNYQWNNNKFACACDFQSSATGTWATEDTTWHAFSSEVRALTTFESPVNLMVGALYQKTRRSFAQNIIFANIEDSSASPENRYAAILKDSATDGETVAVFGQLNWKIVPTLELAAGVRYTHETKDSYFRQPYVNIGLQGVFRQFDAADGLGTINANQTFKNWSPEATITWKPTTDVMVYGAYKTAYKSGGFSNGGLNSQVSANPLADLTFDEERAAGFEMGIKSTFADRQIRLNIVGYSYRYKDLQIDFFNSPIFAFQTLTADARTKGVEIELEFAPHAVPGLNLRGSVSYNRARYTNFIGPCFAGERPDEGCLLNATGQPPTDGSAPLFQNLAGVPLGMAPRWTGAFGADYDTTVGADSRIGLSAFVRYSGSYLASAFNNPDSYQKRYAVLDASLRFSPASERWQLALIGKNLTNRFYSSGAQDGPSTGSGTGTPAGIHADEMALGPLPRTVQLQLSSKF